jgi:hypothetical protein
MKDFSFILTDRDFDNGDLSLWDSNQKKIIAKVKRADLADAPATPEIRRKLETQLRTDLTKSKRI